ncbi:nickel ABC transporter permease [Fretibacterium fastidiosum]|uniref:ABC-type dipeptide/oligopeptide/nickel transport systems, permease components n=1 Tax=Fretibacterium fastidiosum TaxID=651822 RepID=A0AB94IY57_9BACT|nr:nickel ABC transporter permease [Fretibacterium fastidiosum]CBL28637.1 ABC-type dipeptide/oligopeptide/nickel transport systems, permease components [Fretibacterium fastidiosum]
MLRYIIRRVLFLIPVLLGVAFCVFTLLYLTPGDPARMVLGDMATDEAIKEFRDKEGLNDPYLVQFGNYVWKAINGDIGRSYSSRRPVMKELLTAFPYTLKLSAFAMIIAILIGIPCGIISAIKQYSWFDTITMIFAMVGLSMPVFWLGLLLILLFSVHLRWLPSSGFSTFKAMILPSVALAAQSISMVTRMTRSSMLEVVRADYIRTARAKGQKESIVIWVHALRNALIPVVTLCGLQFGSLLSGAILTETVFAVPGVGQLMIRAIMARDYPMVQGGVLFVAIAFSIVNLLVDLLYAYIDPRIKADLV